MCIPNSYLECFRLTPLSLIYKGTQLPKVFLGDVHRLVDLAL